MATLKLQSRKSSQVEGSDSITYITVSGYHANDEYEKEYFDNYEPDYYNHDQEDEDYTAWLD